MSRVTPGMAGPDYGPRSGDHIAEAFRRGRRTDPGDAFFANALAAYIGATKTVRRVQ